MLVRLSKVSKSHSLRCSAGGPRIERVRVLLARMWEAHPCEGGRQCFRVHLASRTLQVIVLPSLSVGGLQSTGDAKARALLVIAAGTTLEPNLLDDSINLH